jgi:hypothetical protein
MKKIVVYIMMLMLGFTSFAQNNESKTDDYQRIIINSYVPDQVEGISESVKNILNSMMDQIITSNGLGAASFSSQFIITPNVVVLTKDITPTAPVMIAMTLETAFIIGDGYNGTKFSSIYFESKGVGTTETKAYISALKQINPRDEKFKNFVEEGKQKIISYYNSKCDFIISEANQLNSQEKYHEAILQLSSVPEVCKECYEKCMIAVAPIYQAKIDKDCKTMLQNAKNTWSSSPDKYGAEKILHYVNSMNPNSSCYPELNTLIEEIKAEMISLNERDWEFEMTKYQDRMEIEKKQQQNAINIRNKELDVEKAVGVAYGNNQPRTVNYKVLSWF